RAKPGLVAVNAAGRRFVDEAVSYHEFGIGMYRSHTMVPTIPAWLVCDREFIEKNGLGRGPPGPRPLPQVGKGPPPHPPKNLRPPPQQLWVAITTPKPTTIGRVTRTFGRLASAASQR